MDQQTFIDFLQRVQAAFLDGRIEEVAPCFAMPLVVYTVAGVTVLRTHDELIAMAVQYRAAIVGLTVDSSQMEIVDWSPPVNRRLRATVRTIDFDSVGRMVTSSLIRYFMVETDGSHTIEMMEYLEAPLPPEEVERLVH